MGDSQLGSILFVCAGNTCRSPMAAGILQRTLQERGHDQILIRTAGITASNNMPASVEAQAIMHEAGININQHRTTLLTAGLINETDLILTMTEHQCQLLRSRFPLKASMIYTLGKASGSNCGDVHDPFGQGVQAYRQTFRQLNQMVDSFVDMIIESK